MKHWLPLSSVGALVLGAGIASSTTIIPPTFDELVTRAETIFIGRAVDSRSEWDVTPLGRNIVTHVTFDVERVIKGRLGLRTELTFLGGTVGDLRMVISDMPEFRLGDRDLLFVSSQVRAVSPLVGFSHGRFRIVRDPVSGVDQVRTHDGRPLASVAEIGKLSAATFNVAPAMAWSEFNSQLRQKLDAQRQR